MCESSQCKRNEQNDPTQPPKSQAHAHQLVCESLWNSAGTVRDVKVPNHKNKLKAVQQSKTKTKTKNKRAIMRTHVAAATHRHTHTDRQTHTDRHTHTQTQTDRHTHTHRHTRRHTRTQTHADTEGTPLAHHPLFSFLCLLLLLHLAWLASFGLTTIAAVVLFSGGKMASACSKTGLPKFYHGKLCELASSRGRFAGLPFGVCAFFSSSPSRRPFCTQLPPSILPTPATQAQLQLQSWLTRT